LDSFLSQQMPMNILNRIDGGLLRVTFKKMHFPMHRPTDHSDGIQWMMIRKIARTIRFQGLL